MRIVVNGTAKEVAHLLSKFDDNEALSVGIEINGHRQVAVLTPPDVAHLRKPMSAAARKRISQAQKKRWAKAR